MKLFTEQNNNGLHIAITTLNEGGNIASIANAMLTQLQADPRIASEIKDIRREDSVYKLFLHSADVINTEINFLWVVYEVMMANSFDVEINHGSLTSAIRALSRTYLCNLPLKGLITLPELGQLDELNDKPRYLLEDSLLKQGQVDNIEATKLHSLLLLLGAVEITTEGEEQLVIKRMAEWLFVAYMRSVFHCSNLFDLVAPIKAVTAIRQMLMPQESETVSIEAQEKLFDMHHVSNAIFEYYNAQIQRYGYEILKHSLNKPESKDVNHLFMHALYIRNDIALLTSLLQKQCMNIEYKLGDEEITLLQFAFKMNNPEIACELLLHKANLFAVSKEMDSALYYLMQNIAKKNKTREHEEDTQQLVDIIFSADGITPEKILQLYSHVYKALPLTPEMLSRFTLANLQAYISNPENFLRQLITHPSDPLRLQAFWILYQSEFGPTCGSFLMTQSHSAQANHDAILCLMNMHASNLFNTIGNRAWFTQTNHSSTVKITTHLDTIIESNKPLAFSILKKYKYSKHKIITDSIFDSFLEIRVINTEAVSKEEANYSLTYVLATCPARELASFIKETKLPVSLICEYGNLSLLRITMSQANLVKYFSLYKKQSHHYSSRSEETDKYNSALQVMTKRKLTVFGSFAAKQVENAIKNNFNLAQRSKQNRKRLFKKLHDDIPLVSKSIAEKIETFPHEFNMRAEDIQAAMINLVSKLLTLDYDVMHASKHSPAVIASGVMLSNHDLANKFICHLGKTSLHDKMFGNDKYVYFVMNTPNKPFPEKLGTFYGNTVFVLSLMKLLELGYQLWLKTSDLYNYAIGKVQTFTIGETRVEYSHHLSENKLSSYRITKYIVDGKAREERINIADESFVNGDIAAGLACVLTNHIQFLDAKTQYDLLIPFAPAYKSFVEQKNPWLDSAILDKQIQSFQNQSISQLHDLIPACELSIARGVNLSAEAIKSIHYIDPEMATKKPEISHYSLVNELYLSIVQQHSPDKIIALISKHPNQVNIRHALFDISLLTASMTHTSYPVMKALLYHGASPHLLSKISKNSAYFTPLINSILLDDKQAFEILLSSKANPNQIIYLDNHGNSSSESNDSMNQPVTAKFIAKLFATSPYFEEQLIEAALSEKHRVIFVARSKGEKILFSRRGSHHVPYGEWVLPTIQVQNIQSLTFSSLKRDLEFLLGYTFNGPDPLQFNHRQNVRLDCIDCSHHVTVIEVDLSKYDDTIPPYSDHFAMIKWCDNATVHKDKKIASLPIQESHLLLVDPSSSNVVFAKKLQAESNGPYALHHAIIKNDMLTVKELLQHQGYANCKVTMLHPETKEWLPGCTPLITATLYASSANHAELLDLLLPRGANIFINNKVGKSFFDYAPPLFLNSLRSWLSKNDNSQFKSLFEASQLFAKDDDNNNNKLQDNAVAAINQIKLG
ncbi:MAG: ankyrin repeat domain-containing protein [Gammaproteobacteria bacterium]|nr:ankyrin repeat domain-containing protein [Gammaproteobacteria bacterium]